MLEFCFFVLSSEAFLLGTGSELLFYKSALCKLELTKEPFEFRALWGTIR